MTETTYDDLKKLIAESYNAIGPKYHAWAAPRPTSDRAAYIERLTKLLPRGSRILELGCGAGVPATKQCVDLGFRVVGVDVSPSLIEIARREIPSAEFHVSDMLSFASSSSSSPSSFDCVMIFYALWHLPPVEQEQVLRKCMQVHLKPGGWLLFNLMTVNGEYNLDSFMGSPMTSWGIGVEGNERMIRRLVDDGLIDESDGETPIGGEVTNEMVGNHEQEMHWFMLRASSVEAQGT